MIEFLKLKDDNFIIYYLPNFSKLDVLEKFDKDHIVYRINTKLQDQIWYFKKTIPIDIQKYCYIIWIEKTALVYRVVILFKKNSKMLILAKGSLCSNTIKNSIKLNVIYSNLRETVHLVKTERSKNG